MHTDMLVWALILHLIVDWLFQTQDMAIYKTNLKKSAGWIHAGLHGLAMLLVFPWPIALAIGVIHLLIDTRKPLQWWATIVKSPTQGEIALHIAIWRDQVLHVAVIALATLMFTVLYR